MGRTVRYTVSIHDEQGQKRLLFMLGPFIGGASWRAKLSEAEKSHLLGEVPLGTYLRYVPTYLCQTHFLLRYLSHFGKEFRIGVSLLGAVTHATVKISIARYLHNALHQKCSPNYHGAAPR